MGLSIYLPVTLRIQSSSLKEIRPYLPKTFSLWKKINEPFRAIVMAGSWFLQAAHDGVILSYEGQANDIVKARDAKNVEYLLTKRGRLQRQLIKEVIVLQPPRL